MFQEHKNTTTHIHYIAGGDGLAAFYVQKEGQEGNYYFAFKDYLGSILTLADKNGTVVQEQSFDPWGRYRNTEDWSYDNLNPPTLADGDFTWLRGYTGHEYLPQFSLIHMNGRLYDPYLGRMLSPDNFVHTDFGTQGYNRYSYAANNPLKYTDPSGEVLWFVAAGFFVGAYVGGTLANDHGNPFKWDYKSHKTWNGILIGGGIGALAGLGVGSGLFSAQISANVAGQTIPLLGISAEAGATSITVAGGVLSGGVALGEINIDLSEVNFSRNKTPHIEVGEITYQILSDDYQNEDRLTNGDYLLFKTYFHFQFGDKDPMNIDASTLNLNYLSEKDLIYNPKTGRYSVNLFDLNPIDHRSLALGKISLTRKENNLFYINSDLYDFNIEKQNGFSKRNIATFGAGLMHYNMTSLIFGGPFKINFEGEIIINP